MILLQSSGGEKLRVRKLLSTPALPIPSESLSLVSSASCARLVK
ncbi:hypothetical protein GEOBRER4_n0469 [Citrifermentans bremense]|uniref:Uncharacterized protein n=1 Tax=Citrifermentans bremense TaxID=60035 RepID=A0A7R7IYG9_9BACT|nr:hypothetical protein GEOBRER4_n0469 [Citrifermentans bremense]